MRLGDYFEKKVKIVFKDKDVLEGEVFDYVYPEDNENNKESIIIKDSKSRYIEVYEKEILSIEII